MYVKDNKKLFIELKSSTLCQNARLRNLGETVENLILNTFLAELCFIRSQSFEIHLRMSRSVVFINQFSMRTRVKQVPQ